MYIVYNYSKFNIKINKNYNIYKEILHLKKQMKDTIEIVSKIKWSVDN